MSGKFRGYAVMAATLSVAMWLPIDSALSAATKIKIFFHSTERLDQYDVSGIWFPDVKDRDPGGLHGRAVFTFEDTRSGRQWTIAVDGIALLDDDFWNQHQVADASTLEDKVLLEKLSKFSAAPIAISMSQDKRAKLLNCDDPNSEYPPELSGKDQCLRLGNALVDLQDIDFDGKKELVFLQRGMAQRNGDAYKVVRNLGEEARSLASDISKPFGEFDFRTAINVTRKQIIINGSGGACDSMATTYSRKASGMRLTHLWKSVMEEPDNCYFEDYAVEDPKDGKGQQLKLLSRRKSD